MRAKSLITAALAVTAATTLVVISSRPTFADPAPAPSEQDNLSERVKQLEAEVKALREELKALKGATAPLGLEAPQLRDYFKGEGKDRARFGITLPLPEEVYRYFESVSPNGDGAKAFTGVPSNLQIEVKDGKTILKILKPGDKQPRTYELPRDKAKLEQDFPGMKMFHGESGKMRMWMFGPSGEFKTFDSKEFEAHMKELRKRLSKELSSEVKEKLKLERETLRKYFEKRESQVGKASESTTQTAREPSGVASISI